MTNPTNELPPTSPAEPARPDAWTILNTPIHPRKRIAGHLRAKMIAGLITAIPLFVTIWAAVIVYGLITRFTDEPAKWIVRLIAGDATTKGLVDVGPTALNALNYLAQPTLAVAISLLIVYILGLLGTFVIGRRLLAAGEHFISNLPLIKGIYGTTKQVIGVFRQGGGGAGFQRVVLVEFPREGTWTIGFVTKTLTDTAANIRYVCVFIPMTPNPTSGFFQMFPESSVRNTDWTVDQGIKIVLSGGLLAPDELNFGSATAAAAAPQA